MSTDDVELKIRGAKGVRMSKYRALGEYICAHENK